jgi:hypothetical protein
MIGKEGCAWLLDEGVQAGIDLAEPGGDFTEPTSRFSKTCLNCRHQLNTSRCSKCLAHALFESN